MTNYDLQEILEKDRIAKEFINQVNPYQTRPSLGIDLRALAKRAKKDNLKIANMTKDELSYFTIN